MEIPKDICCKPLGAGVELIHPELQKVGVTAKFKPLLKGGNEILIQGVGQKNPIIYRFRGDSPAVLQELLTIAQVSRGKLEVTTPSTFGGPVRKGDIESLSGKFKGLDITFLITERAVTSHTRNRQANNPEGKPPLVVITSFQRASRRGLEYPSTNLAIDPSGEQAILPVTNDWLEFHMYYSTTTL